MHQLFGQLDNRFVTLPESLRDAGWYTVGFSANPLMGRLSNYTQGFRRFFDAASIIPDGDPIQHASGSAKALNRHVLPWIEQNTEWPYFLYVHSIDPHENYEPAPEYLKLFADPAHEAQYRKEWQALVDAKPGQVGNYSTKEHFEKAGVAVEPFIEYGKELYDADIRANDDEIARVIDALDRKGQLDDMVVVVTADHGEEFFEHGGFGHGFTLHREVVDVPLLIRLPGGAGGGAHVAEPVSLVDVAPTLLDRLGLLAGQPDGKFGDGVSLAPLLHGGKIERDAPIVAQLERGKQGKAFLLEQWPLRLILTGRDYAGREDVLELFDLEKDPDERHDLLAGDAARAAELRRKLAARRSQLESAALPTTTEELDEATRRKMEALGYGSEKGGGH
jgi:arylsulfatase A-like enzyme